MILADINMDINMVKYKWIKLLYNFPYKIIFYIFA